MNFSYKSRLNFAGKNIRKERDLSPSLADDTLKSGLKQVVDGIVHPSSQAFLYISSFQGKKM